MAVGAVAVAGLAGCGRPCRTDPRPSCPLPSGGRSPYSHLLQCVCLIVMETQFSHHIIPEELDCVQVSCLGGGLLTAL